MITFHIFHKGSYGYQIKTGIKKNRIEIGYHSTGYSSEQDARKAADEILDVYRKRYEVTEIK